MNDKERGINQWSSGQRDLDEIASLGYMCQTLISTAQITSKRDPDPKGEVNILENLGRCLDALSVKVHCRLDRVRQGNLRRDGK